MYRHSDLGEKNKNKKLSLVPNLREEEFVKVIVRVQFNLPVITKWLYLQEQFFMAELGSEAII